MLERERQNLLLPTGHKSVVEVKLVSGGGEGALAVVLTLAAAGDESVAVVLVEVALVSQD
jgi:hypothetical protein